jgi:hypothetical protein
LFQRFIRAQWVWTRERSEGLVRTRGIPAHP